MCPPPMPNSAGRNRTYLKMVSLRERAGLPPSQATGRILRFQLHTKRSRTKQESPKNHAITKHTPVCTNSLSKNSKNGPHHPNNPLTSRNACLPRCAYPNRPADLSRIPPASAGRLISSTGNMLAASDLLLADPTNHAAFLRTLLNPKYRSGNTNNQLENRVLD
jgi:hypothetical protein